MGLWSLKDYGIAAVILALGSSTVLIVVGVMLFAGILTVFLTGWLNTIIYTLSGIGIFAVIKWVGLPKLTPYAYLSVLIIPIMGLIGYGVNHTSYISWAPNLASLIESSPTFMLSQNAVTGEVTSFVLNFQNFGAIMSTVGAVLSVASIFVVRYKPRHRR